MRSSLLAVALLAAASCTGASESTDGPDEVGLSDGKSDGANPTACEAAAIVTLVNEAVSAEALEDAGVNARAARNLFERKPYATLQAIDAVSYVGPVTLGQLVDAVADACAAPADPFAQARDVTLHKITFPDGTVAPTDYAYPDGNGFSLGGTEFWQKWSGGHNPTYSFDEGTDKGRLCMQASAIRFTTIMADAPAELKELNEKTSWSGSFFNWNDDYSGEGAYGDASSARLWAWRTSLVKWISQTAKDGSCYLPTRAMVVAAATKCLATGAANAGEIMGCRN